jgi:hypothetical protein
MKPAMRMLSAIFLLAAIAIGAALYFDGTWTREQPTADPKAQGTLRGNRGQ